jgi:hypothetical protein
MKRFRKAAFGGCLRFGSQACIPISAVVTPLRIEEAQLALISPSLDARGGAGHGPSPGRGASLREAKLWQRELRKKALRNYVGRHIVANCAARRTNNLVRNDRKRSKVTRESIGGRGASFIEVGTFRNSAFSNIRSAHKSMFLAMRFAAPIPMSLWGEKSQKTSFFSKIPKTAKGSRPPDLPSVSTVVRSPSMPRLQHTTTFVPYLTRQFALIHSVMDLFI